MKNPKLSSRLEELTQKAAFLIHAIGRIPTQLNDIVPDEKTTSGGQLLLYELQAELDALVSLIESETGRKRVRRQPKTKGG